MTDLTTRPWVKHYGAGVRADFQPERTSWNAMMAQAFADYGEVPLLEYYGEVITYDALAARIGAAAAFLKAQGIGPGDRVALHLPNAPWHPVFFYAALSMGAAVTHLSPLDATQEIAHKLTTSGAKMLVTLSTPGYVDQIVPLVARGECPLLVQCDDPVSRQGREPHVLDGALEAGSELAAFEGAPFEIAEVDPEAPALLQYTGGTTGLPKAAVLTQGNLAAAVQIYHEFSADEPAADPGAPGLLYSPLFHIMGLVTALLKRTYEGGVIHLRLRFDAAQAVDEIKRLGIRSFGGVPTSWIAMSEVEGADPASFASLQYPAAGGAPMPPEVWQRVKTLTGLSIRGGWGMTETGAAGSNIPRDFPEEKVGTIGIPLPGIDMRVVALDDPACVLATGETGEIAIKGANVTVGYWERPEETAQAILDGWLMTGDVGYMDEEGYFYIVDRKKDLILSGGFNVYPLVIEKAVHQHPDVVEAMAIGVPDAYRGESAKVFVRLREGAPAFSLEELNGFLADKLGRHEVPRHLEFRDILPHTPVGKADRKALRAEELADGKRDP